MKWVDEFFEEDECTLYQISVIESLLKTSASSFLYDEIDISSLTYNEAETIIKDLRENDKPIDPREQFKQMFN